MEISWCAPVSGDGPRLPAGGAWERPPTLDAVVDVFRATERAGFRHSLIGMGFDRHALEAWTVGTAALARTTTAGAMIAVRPGFYSAPILAKMAATLDRMFPDRLALNVVTGGRIREQAMYGDRLDHDARYRRTREFLTICKRLWTTREPFDFRGDYYDLEGTVLDEPPATKGGPPIYFGGASGPAELVGAELADVYLLWGESLAETTARIARMRWLVAQAGRSGAVRYGIRINVVARKTEHEAREAARDIVANVSLERRAQSKQRDLAATERDSIGQKRQWDLANRADADGYVEPGLFAGIAWVRSGAGMALVGSYEQVAERLRQYGKLGIDVAILSGFPHAEECARVGKEVAPLL